MPWEKIWAFVQPFTNTVLVCVIGYFLVRLLARIVSRPFVRAKFDDSLVRFVRKAIKIVGYVLVFVTALATLGVPTTSLAATLSGAALATLISQFVSFFAALIFYLKHREHLGLTRKYLRPRADRIRAITKLGLPTAFQWAIASLSWLVVAYLINGHGDASLIYSAANGVSNKIKDFCQLFISAMTGAASTMVAQNLGAALYDRARNVMKTCMKITLGMAAILIIISELLAPVLVSFFTPDPQVQHWAAINLRIEIIGQLFYAGFFTYNTLATGCGDTMFVMWNSFVNCIIFRLVLAIIFNHFWGVHGVYIACAIAPASSVPIGWFYCRKGYWKKSLTNRKG